MRKLFLDFETRSECDVSVAGSHRYILDPTTDVLLVSYAFDNEPVQTVDLFERGGFLPVDLLDALYDDDVLKIAHNAEFEMCICRYKYHISVNPEAWFDTAYQAAYFGYPRKLSHLARSLRTLAKGSQEEMLLFAQPLKQRARRGEEPVKLWATKETHPAEWGRFLKYSSDDVAVMRECYDKMPALPNIELFVMRATFVMNFNGIPFDIKFALQIYEMSEEYAKRAGEKALDRFGIKNLRSTQQVKEALWREGVLLDSLNKKDRNGQEHEILVLRDQATGSAFSKVKTAVARICQDLRLRGEFVGHGAHTGRWSSRGVQCQNFARILSDVSTDLTKVKSYDHLRQHMRLCIHAPKPQLFTCADLSQIEARIVAWLAGCEWRMKAFANGEDIYSRSAEKMFGLPHVDKTMPERQMGKCAELGLGYGGSGRAIGNINADFYREQGEAKIDEIVRRWRAANPEICQLWRSLERAFKQAMVKGVTTLSCGPTRINFFYDGHTARIELPSGRSLYYRGTHGDNGDLYYLDYSRGGDLPVRTKFWGGVLLENITQAIARDVLVDIMSRIAHKYPKYYLIGTVHDEVWYLSKDENALDNLLNEMSSPISWAGGLVTKGDGFTHDRYIK